MKLNAFRDRSRLLAVLAIGLITRIVVACYLGDAVPPKTDETSYHTLAARVAAGYGYTFPTGWYPFTPSDTATAHWSFLYTGFLAGIYSVSGPHPLAGRLVGAVTGGILLPWLMNRLAQRMSPGGNRSLPLLAAALAACYAYFILFAAQLMTETLFICALLWSLERGLALETAVCAGHPPGRTLARLGLALGAALGLATLMRQSILPWAAVLFVYLLLRGWRHGNGRCSLAAVTLAGSVIVAAILPFTLRNLEVYNESFLLLNSNAGYAMYAAQHPGHGTSFREYWAAPLPEDLAGRGLNEAEWDRELMRRGAGFVLAQPGRYLLLSLSRVRDYFEFWPTTDSSALFNLGRSLSIGALLPFMVAGIALWLRPGICHTFGLASPALLLLFMTFYSAMHILTWAMSRYRLPVDAAALPFAALALLALHRAVALSWAAKASAVEKAAR